MLELDPTEMTESINYEICVREVLDEKWTAYFAPFTLEFGRPNAKGGTELPGYKEYTQQVRHRLSYGIW